MTPAPELEYTLFDRDHAWARGFDFPPMGQADGITIVVDGVVAAFGGIFEFDGRRVAFFNLFDKRAARPAVLHRLVKRGLIEAAIDERPIISFVDHDLPRAEVWHKRLGFRPMTDGEKDWVIEGAEARTGGKRAWIYDRI